MWIVAGLGNPGPEYAETRHNVGFLVAEALAAGDPAARFRRVGPALAARATLAGRELLLLKPQTFMNRSGQPLAAALEALEAPPEGLVVIHDEVDLPFGTLRLKAGGGHGGHNGLRSIVAELGTRDFLRVRVGIGRSEASAELTDWVLGPFGPPEREALPDLLERAARATLDLIAEGFTAAANRWNVRPGRAGNASDADASSAGSAPETAAPSGSGPGGAAPGEPEPS